MSSMCGNVKRLSASGVTGLILGRTVASFSCCSCRNFSSDSRIKASNGSTSLDFSTCENLAYLFVFFFPEELVVVGEDAKIPLVPEVGSVFFTLRDEASKRGETGLTRRLDTCGRVHARVSELMAVTHNKSSGHRPIASRCCRILFMDYFQLCIANYMSVIDHQGDGDVCDPNEFCSFVWHSSAVVEDRQTQSMLLLEIGMYITHNIP